MALHRLADKTALIVASDNPAYSDVWNAASKLSRSRRVYGTASDPVAQSRHPSSRENTMRVDMAEETDSGRRMSNAGIELGDWINKYQKSDHHSDRLVRTIVQYEQTTGQRFPDSKLIPASYSEIKRNHVSALPDVVYVKTASTYSQPVTYDLPTVRRPSIDYSVLSPATRPTYGVNNVSMQLQRSPAISVSTGRPPVAPRPVVDVSRAASLPPVSIDSLHRRRPSVSSTYNGPVRATSQRYASPALPTIRAGESVAGYRRASYSGISSNYRPRSVSRHTTPDRVIDEDASRYVAVAGRPNVNTVSWSTRSRSPSPPASPANYIFPTPPGTPRMSEARRKIRKVLNRMAASDGY